MKHLKSFTLLITLILLAGTLHPDVPITFNWAFLYRQDTDDIKTIPLDESGTTLKAGDEIKVYLHPVENAYIYLFLFDTSENLYLLFPTRISFFDRYYKNNTIYSFPGGNEWAILDNPQDSPSDSPTDNPTDNPTDQPLGCPEGTDEFILIVSSTRLKKLEKLIVSYNNLFFKEEKDASKLAEARSIVIEEIQQLKHEHSRFTRKAKEKLIKVAVEIRNAEEKEEIPMVEIKADTFYTKTVRIQH